MEITTIFNLFLKGRSWKRINGSERCPAVGEKWLPTSEMTHTLTFLLSPCISCDMLSKDGFVTNAETNTCRQHPLQKRHALCFYLLTFLPSFTIFSFPLRTPCLPRNRSGSRTISHNKNGRLILWGFARLAATDGLQGLGIYPRTMTGLEACRFHQDHYPQPMPSSLDLCLVSLVHLVLDTFFFSPKTVSMNPSAEKNEFQ